MPVVDIKYLQYRTIEPGARILIFGSPEDTAIVAQKIVKQLKCEGDVISPHPKYWTASSPSIDTEELKDVYYRQGMHFPPPNPQEAIEHQILHFLPSFIFEDNLDPALFEVVNRYTVIPTRYTIWHHLFPPHHKNGYTSWYKKILSAPPAYKLTRILTLEPCAKLPPSYFPLFDYIFYFPSDSSVWKHFTTPYIQTEADFIELIATLKPSEGVVKTAQELYLTTTITRTKT